MHRNVTEILNLHEEILSQIRGVLSESEGISGNQADHASKPPPRHASRHYGPKGKATLAAGLAQVARRSFEETWFWKSKAPPLVSDPQEVAEVSKVFDRLV